MALLADTKSSQQFGDFGDIVVHITPTLQNDCGDAFFTVSRELTGPLADFPHCYKSGCGLSMAGRAANLSVRLNQAALGVEFFDRAFVQLSKKMRSGPDLVPPLLHCQSTQSLDPGLRVN